MSDKMSPELCRAIARREFLMKAATGTVITAMAGGLYMISDHLTGGAKADDRPDGRPRVPPGQRVLESLKPMGGQPGSPRRSEFRLKVHGEVDKPYEIDFQELIDMDVVTQRADVHCVTGWTVLGAKWKGVRIKDLAAKAKLKRTARHVVFEAAHAYTANVRLDEATTDDCLITWELDDKPLRRANGSPVRGLVPDLYFWKSAKFITGIKFVRRDEPGYWEVRGYNNHADPWREERYS